MPYDPQRHHRRSIRLQYFDYSQPGAYFITLVTYQRIPFFGEIVSGEIWLSAIGEILRSALSLLEQRFSGLILDECVIMPNHLHMVIFLGQDKTDLGEEQTPPAIGQVVGAFKSLVTHQVIQSVRQGIVPPFPGKIWHRNYYEHVIRSQKELDLIRQYIVDNPFQWQQDPENPECKS